MQKDRLTEVNAALKALANMQTDAEKESAIEGLVRLGKELSVADLKEVMACGCGPNGERGIESWPCV